MELSTTVHCHGPSEVLFWAIKEARNETPPAVSITREPTIGGRHAAILRVEVTNLPQKDRDDLKMAADLVKENVTRGLKMDRFLRDVYGLHPKERKT